MNNIELPHKRVLSTAFKEKGRSDVVKLDVFPVNDRDLVKLVFESMNSPWRQGVWLKTDDYLVVNEQQCPSVQVWQDTAPREVLVECRTRNGLLHLYNIWDKGNGRESQSWTSGMLVEELPTGRRYFCNDIGIETSFTKLIFRVERVPR